VRDERLDAVHVVVVTLWVHLPLDRGEALVDAHHVPPLGAVLVLALRQVQIAEVA
jgi:hypothetical protein